MEEQKKKAILDVECIHCIHFFTCNGKAEKGQLCIGFRRREEQEDGRTKNVYKESDR